MEHAQVTITVHSVISTPPRSSSVEVAGWLECLR